MQENRGSTVLVLMMGAHAVSDGAGLVIPGLMPILRADLHLSYTHVGTLFSVSLLTAVVSQHVFGILGTRFAPKRLLMGGVASVTAGLVMVVYSSSFLTLLAALVVLRFGTGAYHPLGSTWLARRFRKRGLSFAMGAQSAGGDLGILATFIVTWLLAGTFGWRGPPLFWVVVCVGLMLGILLIRDPWHPPASSTRPDIGTAAGSRHILVFGLLAGGMFGVIFSYTPLLLTERGGVDTPTANLIMALWIGAGILSALMYARAARSRLGGTIVLLASLVIFSAAIPLSLTTDIYLMGASTLVLGLALFIIYPAIQTEMAVRVERGSESQAFALLFNSQMGASSLFAFLAGVSSDMFGISSAPALVSLLGLGSALYAIDMVRRGGPASRNI